MTCTIVQCVGGWEGQRAESCCCHFGSRTLRATLKSCDHGVVIMESTQAVPSEGGGRCRAQFCVVATSRSQRRRRPLSGTVLRCRDKPFPAKGAAAVGHSFALSRQAVPSEGGGRCRAQFCVVATSRSQRRGRPLSGTLCGVATSRSQRRGWLLSGTVLRCRDKPFPAKGAAAVGHVVAVSRQAVPGEGGGRCRAPSSHPEQDHGLLSARAPGANGVCGASRKVDLDLSAANLQPRRLEFIRVLFAPGVPAAVHRCISACGVYRERRSSTLRGPAWRHRHGRQRQISRRSSRPMASCLLSYICWIRPGNPV